METEEPRKRVSWGGETPVLSPSPQALWDGHGILARVDSR